MASRGTRTTSPSSFQDTQRPRERSPRATSSSTSRGGGRPGAGRGSGPAGSEILDALVCFRYPTPRARMRPAGGDDEAHSTRRIRASLPAQGCARAGIDDHARDRCAGRPDPGPRAQVDATPASRGVGEERSRAQWRLPACPAGGGNQCRRRAGLPGRQLLLQRLLPRALRQRAHLRAQQRLLDPRALDRDRPRGAARPAEHEAQRPAPHRAGDGRLDPRATRPLSLEDSLVSAPPTIQELASRQYKYGFVTDIESDTVPRGLNEDVIRLISSKKNEPAFMLEWRLKAYRHWLTMKEPRWQNVRYPPIDYQDIVYYSAPKPKGQGPKSLEEVDPELLKAFGKLGIPLEEQKMLSGVAVDAVFDSVSVATTFKEKLAKAGVIFCSFSEAVQNHPELVKKYLGSVVPYSDNFFATLNSAVFSDGSFVYVPKGVRCPMELSTYFRINAENTGQFERTLIIAEEGAYVSYLEGCTAPMRDKNQLHAAVVELVALDKAQIKYSTVQNWYPGDAQGRGGIYNFVTKRGAARGRASKISWTQVETGSAITWKYPSVILQGDDSVGEFHSVALTNNYQQADTGTKMIHIGKNTRSTILSKGISAGHGQNTYRGLVRIQKGATGSRNYTQCDSLLLGSNCGAHTMPYIEVKNTSSQVEHEASTSKIGEDQLFYCTQRGISQEDAVSMIVNGFCREVFKELPMEFAVEAQKLLSVSLEGSIG